MSRDTAHPRYARCDDCGRNQHKVAVRLDPQTVRDEQARVNAQADRRRERPWKVWPTIGLCPSCYADRLKRNPAYPMGDAFVVYDRRTRKPELVDTTDQSAIVSSAMKNPMTEEVTMNAVETQTETVAQELPNLHAVFATDGEHNTYRVSDPLSWNAAQNEWTRLDDLRREGRLPQAKFFEVRQVTLGPDRALVGPEVRSHDRYDGAKLNMQMTRVVSTKHPRGFGDVLDAARAAWKLSFPSYTPRKGSWSSGEQGYGGWYYWPNGRTAAQGLLGLAPLCKRRGMVVQGANGRWYVVETEQL